MRKSLQGLDYITASGSKAFDELENVTGKVGELGMGMSWAKQQKQQLKLAKRYLKSDYKVRTTKNLNKILINRFYKRTGGSLGCAPGCDAGGRAFDSDRTNTQGLKITE